MKEYPLLLGIALFLGLSYILYLLVGGTFIVNSGKDTILLPQVEQAMEEYRLHYQNCPHNGENYSVQVRESVPVECKKVTDYASLITCLLVSKKLDRETYDKLKNIRTIKYYVSEKGNKCVLDGS